MRRHLANELELDVVEQEALCIYAFAKQETIPG